MLLSGGGGGRQVEKQTAGTWAWETTYISLPISLYRSPRLSLVIHFHLFLSTSLSKSHWSPVHSEGELNSIQITKKQIHQAKHKYSNVSDLLLKLPGCPSGHRETVTSQSFYGCLDTSSHPIIRPAKDTEQMVCEVWWTFPAVWTEGMEYHYSTQQQTQLITSQLVHENGEDLSPKPPKKYQQLKRGWFEWMFRFLNGQFHVFPSPCGFLFKFQYYEKVSRGYRWTSLTLSYS